MMQPDMNTEHKQELYTSPEVKVIEIKSRQVICQSTGGTQQYEEDNWNF